MTGFLEGEECPPPGLLPAHPQGGRLCPTCPFGGWVLGRSPTSQATSQIIFQGWEWVALAPARRQPLAPGLHWTQITSLGGAFGTGGH